MNRRGPKTTCVCETAARCRTDRTLMAVEIAASPEFHAGVPKPLFQLPPNALAGDVTPDGKRRLQA